ncbi:ADP-ribosylglycohydrolase family protein [Sphaerochaeta halotolerans]|uniref:ADP-ribosylglycohydrolase family protein n=1 Tax=Sphaerochaeta halotolerans TaxID=2293840 RepID=UPI0013698EC4|nr:ADP-ribosylglycohydrolase family protein [Sphaerochaeta halotolerans]MXI85533.1 hypothetical protein [Sphaerochaeta halotolerans]
MGISDRRVRRLCNEGRIEGATKMGSNWIIPDHANKPIDARTHIEKHYKGIVYDFQAVDALKQAIDNHRPFSATLARTLHENLLVEWTYHSNAIEWNTLTLTETKVVLEGLTIGGKTMVEHLEAMKGINTSGQALDSGGVASFSAPRDGVSHLAFPAPAPERNHHADSFPLAPLGNEAQRDSSFPGTYAIVGIMSIQERANGALLGLFVGDGFGSQCDGLSKETLQEEGINTLQEVFSLEHLRSDCGISGEVSDLALLLSMSLLSNQCLDADHFHALVNRYREEREEGYPLDAYRAALPLSVVVAIAGIELKQKQVRDIALNVASLFCEDPLEKEAVAFFAHCLYLLINEEVFDAEKLVHDLLTQRGGKNLDEQLTSLLSRARKPELILSGNHTLKETLLLVFHTVLHAPNFEQGMSDVAMMGGDARLACGLYGALQGALRGPDLFPDHWIDELVSSSAVEQAIKKQTLFKRETIKMERLALTMSERLLNAAVFGR